MPVFEPGRASEWGSEGVIGLRNAKIDPARASGRSCGLRKPRFDPGMALERGAGGLFGLRKPRFEPGKAVRSGLRGANGIEIGDFEPESEFGRGCELRKQHFDPE